MPDLTIYIHHAPDGSPRYVRHTATREAGTSLNVRTPWGDVAAWTIPAEPGTHLVTAHEPEGPERIVAQIIVQ